MHNTPSYYYVAENGFDNLYNAGIVRIQHETIMAKAGFRPLQFPAGNKKNPLNGIKRSLQLLRYFFSISKNSIVFFHFPMQATAYKWLLHVLKWRGVHTAAIIIDIDGLRDQNKKLLAAETTLLSKFNYLVAHNTAMKNFLLSYLPGKAIFTIDLFDYLCDFTPSKKTLSNTVCIAANFSKASFVYQLKSPGFANYFLYGPGYDASFQLWPNNIYYKGLIDPGVLPSVMEGSFGLVWDGNSPVEADNYLRYNNPHKLSLYLAAGLPVIVWDQSAVADLIIQKKAGITVSSLDEIEEKLTNISVAAYTNMQQQATLLGEAIRNGYHLKKIIREITKQ